MKILRITLEGKTYEVGVEVLDETAPVTSTAPRVAPPAATQAMAPPAAAPQAVPASEGCRVVACPMAGQVFKCLVKPGDVVTLNQIVVVLEAMKMESPVHAPVAGKVRAVLVKEGDAVDEGHALLEIEE